MTMPVERGPLRGTLPCATRAASLRPNSCPSGSASWSCTGACVCVLALACVARRSKPATRTERSKPEAGSWTGSCCECHLQAEVDLRLGERLRELRSVLEVHVVVCRTVHQQQPPVREVYRFVCEASVLQSRRFLNFLIMYSCLCSLTSYPPAFWFSLARPR